MDSAVLFVLLILLLSCLTTGTYFISVCNQRGIWGLDPTLNKPVFISNYENCGRACKFSVNRASIDELKRLNTFRQITGTSLLFLSVILIVIIIKST
jgi:hypothetical protein